MKRKFLIENYISNYDELKLNTKKNLLEDLEVFRDDIFSKLVKEKTYVIILPVKKSFTDIKEFSSWKGKVFDISGYGKHPFYKTFDEVRGWGGNPTVIGEEWILARDKDIFNVVRHEIAHQIHGNILNKSMLRRIHKAFLKAKKNNNYIRQNSSINESEYFADGVTFYFNNAKSRKIKIYDMSQICNRSLLFKKDKVLHDIVKAIFITK
ncbi:hypothetical protein HYX08_00265 [Candidatus Woesearchaeota archaeon]|nr:hypothetical protein [Candidatus Woesearchaeota archaeon]